MTAKMRGGATPETQLEGLADGKEGLCRDRERGAFFSFKCHATFDGASSGMYLLRICRQKSTEFSVFFRRGSNCEIQFARTRDARFTIRRNEELLKSGIFYYY